MANKRYAAIARITKQVTGFVNKPSAINGKFGFVVDLENHPQANEIEIGWFYDEESSTFSADGEIVYVEPKIEVTNEELQAQNETLMLALAEQYEKQLAIEENQNTMMLAIAELYETSIATDTPTEGGEE